MGTPGDRLPVSKVVHGQSDNDETGDLTQQSILDSTSEMTILRDYPNLGIYIEHGLDPTSQQHKDVIDPLNIETLQDLEKQLIFGSKSVLFEEQKKDFPDDKVFLDQRAFADQKPLGKLKSFEEQKLFEGEVKSFIEDKSFGDPKSFIDQKSFGVMQELSLPGPSGLQTPKLKTTVKVAPKRSKKPSTRVAPSSPSTPKKPHSCSICNKNFQNVAKLVSHQVVHSGGTPFKCEHCKKSFSSKFKLVRHVLIHSDRKPFSCTVCERTFHRKDHLKNHIKVHSPSKKIYTCEKLNCKKEYTSLMSFRKHLALHSAEEGGLECKICLKTFETKADILYHLKIHAGSRTVKNPNEKKFTCDFCDRKFFTRKDVRRHLVVHTGTRNFLCQFCPQRFGRKDHLVRHIKKSHSTNYTETETSEPQPIETVLIKNESQSSVETQIEYATDDNKKVQDNTDIPQVENILFSRRFTELSPMLCSDPDLQYLPSSETDNFIPGTRLPSDTELLTELVVMKEELEQQLNQESADVSMLNVPHDIDELNNPQLLPSDMIDTDILRLISEGGTEDENLPLPGFSQAFQQPP